MPFNKRTVEPIHLSQVQVLNDISNELECVTNHPFSNVIRQFSSLSVHTKDLFDELITDTEHIFQRLEAIHDQIEKLKPKVIKLDSNFEEKTIQDVNNAPRIDQQVVNRATLPKSLRLLHENVAPVPALHLPKPNRDDNRDTMKYYTNPSFLSNLRKQSMKQFLQKHHGHRSGKHERHRSSKGYQQQKVHYQETIYASNPTSFSQSHRIHQTSDKQYYQQQHRNPQDVIYHQNSFDQIARATVPNHSQLLQYPDNNHLHDHLDLMQYDSPTLSTSSSTREQQSITINFSTSTPESSSNTSNERNIEQSPRLNAHSLVITRQASAPSSLLSQSKPTTHISHHSMMKQTSAKSSTSVPPLPPPPLPPAPPPSVKGTATLATIFEINSLLSPPTDSMEQSSSSLPSSIPLNVPLAPPLPNSTTAETSAKVKSNTNSNNLSLSQKDNVSASSETSIQDQRSYIMRDLHSDLLEEIKKGIKLKNRKKKEEEKKATITTKTPLLNVMAIMEQAAKYRRDKIRPQSESENDDESSQWDDSK